MTREEAIKIIDCYDIGFYDLSGEKIPADKLADAFDMAIEALQGDMYCPNCGVRLVPENEYLEPTQTHGRLIDADALIDKLPIEYSGSPIHLLINDAPTVQVDRPHGEWVQVFDNTWECTNCENCEQFGEVPESTSDFCPWCGADMRKEKK